MDAAEIAMQLTIAWIGHSAQAGYSTEDPPGQKAAQAYDTILIGVCKAMDKANQLKKPK
jgi:hypothetical protein